MLPASALPSFSGSLSTPVQLAGSGVWATGSTLSWVVTDNEDGTWRYSYNLVVPQGGVSHFIVEASPTFTLDDILNPEGPYNLGPYVDTFASGPGNPGMPGSIYGIKFDDTSGTNAMFSFDSPRMPVWGDFYAKDGNAGGMGVNYVYNAGFTNPDYDPNVPISDGSVDNHILVPDTKMTNNVVPEAQTIVLASLGLLPVAAVGRGLRRARRV